MAVTLLVVGSRAALSAKMPPPQPMSRYVSDESWRAEVVVSGCDCRHPRMKSCRTGFIRCRSRDEPWGSHHSEAKASKCDTSSGLTDEKVECHFDVAAAVDGKALPA